MEKRQSLKLSVLAIGAAIGMSFAVSAHADDANIASGTDAARHARHEQMHQCVKAALASENITLPEHQPGQRPELDATTRAAMKAARQSCWAQLRASETSSTGG